MVKYIWPLSKNIEHGQKILNAAKNFFEQADGLGISVDHDIPIGCQMFESGVKFWIFLSFCISAMSKITGKLCKFCDKITQTFLNLEGAPKWIPQEKLQNIWYLSQISTFNNWNYKIK